jgi:HEPN domain-containing protein
MQSDEYKLWFKKADDNLKWASDNLIDGNYSLVCFLSQQAVELTLKGYLYLKEVIPVKTHSLVNLISNYRL